MRAPTARGEPIPIHWIVIPDRSALSLDGFGGRDMEPWNPPDAFQASSMALSKEEDTGFTSVLPFGPWLRYPIWSGALRRARQCLAWVALSRLGVLHAFFGACLGWNVAFLRKGLFDGLSWMGPD